MTMTSSLAIILRYLPLLTILFTVAVRVSQSEVLGLHTVANKVNVYVYDHPVFNNTDMIECYRQVTGVSPWLHERFDMAQNLVEIWLHRSLLIHPWRVLDPEDADLYFVPIYPFLSFHLFVEKKYHGCIVHSHWKRMAAAVTYLTRQSYFFKRFGGTDHIIICTWWNCRNAFGRWQRMILRRAILGVHEEVDYWTEWGCLGHYVTVPYVASSALTNPKVLGGIANKERTIPFFFVGTTRNRKERKNLQVVGSLIEGSVIKESRDGHVWGEDGATFADHMTYSRFCFCPRGDSFSSRRIYDAIAAGCIPVITMEEARVLPYIRTGINYSDFTIIAPSDTFRSQESVAGLVDDLVKRSDDRLEALQKGLRRAMASLLYGITDGPDWDDMRPFMDTTTRFLQEAIVVVETKRWDCRPQHVNSRPLKKQQFNRRFRPSDKTVSKFPPTPEERTLVKSPHETPSGIGECAGKCRELWLSNSETIAVQKHSLLLCVPPNTGSLQYRMLAKRMQGVEHWAANDRLLLFDPLKSGLPLLDVSNATLMTEIYKNAHSGWITIGVVRDPVTRLLSLYLDLVQTLEHLRDKILNNNCERCMSKHEDNEQARMSTSRLHYDVSNTNGKQIDSNIVSRTEGYLTWLGIASDFWRVGARQYITIPTIAEVLEALEVNIPDTPQAFRPMSTMCGMSKSPFDTLVPFETLQETSTGVLMSLPGGIWEMYGASGWGPNKNQSFMQHDYGAISVQDIISDLKGAIKYTTPTNHAPLRPNRVKHLFEGNSCKWTQYYNDEEVLLQVLGVYRDDYQLYGWYRIDEWIERLQACKEGRL